MEKSLILEKWELESEELKDNFLGDPSRRENYILYPEKNENLPIIMFLPGMMGTSLGALLNYDPLSENLNSRINRLYSSGILNGSIFVFPDVESSIGGCQYLNSSVAGNYENYIVKEVIPQLKERFNSDSVGILGKSSGGYGSITLGMKHPDLINAVMDHSGDAYFEYCYLPDFPKARKEIEKYGTAEKWFENYLKKDNRKLSVDMDVLNIVAMSAFYSSHDDVIQLPFDVYSGEILDEVWNRWLENDPVRMLDRYSESLEKMKFVGIDVGLNDQFNLLLGSRIMHRELEKKKIAHFYEEFEDTHFNIQYRYDISIPKMEKSLLIGE